MRGGILLHRESAEWPQEEVWASRFGVGRKGPTRLGRHVKVYFGGSVRCQCPSWSFGGM